MAGGRRRDQRAEQQAADYGQHDATVPSCGEANSVKHSFLLAPRTERGTEPGSRLSNRPVVGSYTRVGYVYREPSVASRYSPANWTGLSTMDAFGFSQRLAHQRRRRVLLRRVSLPRLGLAGAASLTDVWTGAVLGPAARQLHRNQRAAGRRGAH
jgi:hypothetical protein